jgi:hypothetical protein
MEPNEEKGPRRRRRGPTSKVKSVDPLCPRCGGKRYDQNGERLRHECPRPVRSRALSGEELKQIAAGTWRSSS